MLGCFWWFGCDFMAFAWVWIVVCWVGWLRGCWLFVSFVWIDDLCDFGWLFVYRLALVGVWVC